MNYIFEHWSYLTTKGAYPGVDFLRAFAVILVVLFHFKLLYIGWIGVDLFFVISGFLIGGIILDRLLNNNFSLREFYWHRILRIIPTYYFILFLGVFLKLNQPIDVTIIKNILSSMLFLQTTGPYFFPNVFMLNPLYLVGGSWSLVVEEVFYLIAPFFLIFIMKITRKNLLTLLVVLCFIVFSGILSRLKMTSGFSPNDYNWHFISFIQFHSRYDELVFGVLAAVIVRYSTTVKIQSAWWTTIGIFFICLFLAYINGNQNFLLQPSTITRDTIWLPTLLGGVGFSLILGCHWWEMKFHPVLFMARLSYPLYLVHILFTVDRLWGTYNVCRTEKYIFIKWKLSNSDFSECSLCLFSITFCRIPICKII